MAASHKILILDDEQPFLEMCQELLAALPTQPEIRTATSGAHALALLGSEPFSLLLTDLKMPSMDGFQVLTIVRRKFPSLRTVVMTSSVDEQFRTRAYALGIDLFLEKPKSSAEMQLFVDCIESLLERETQGGFRGVQSKSLVDLIQNECATLASCVLKITNGPAEARIWIQSGNLIDATVGDLKGEEAFKKILGWKNGNFETLPDEPNRERTIFASYSGLLLDTVQTMDEAAATGAHGTAPAEGVGAKTSSPLAPLGNVKGVEFVVTIGGTDGKSVEQYGAENAEQLAEWTRETLARFGALGEKLKAGPVNRIEGLGPQRHLGVEVRGDRTLCLGINRALSADQLRETVKQVVAKWAS